MAEPTEGERLQVEMWLKGVGAEAVREFTQTRAHGWTKSRMIAHILATPEAFEVAQESMRISLRAHRCSTRCVCPVDGRPLYYAPATGEHACQDVDCVNGHGMKSPEHLPARRV